MAWLIMSLSLYVLGLIKSSYYLIIPALAVILILIISYYIKKRIRIKRASKLLGSMESIQPQSTPLSAYPKSNMSNNYVNITPNQVSTQMIQPIYNRFGLRKKRFRAMLRMGRRWNRRLWGRHRRPRHRF